MYAFSRSPCIRLTGMTRRLQRSRTPCRYMPTRSHACDTPRGLAVSAWLPVGQWIGQELHLLPVQREAANISLYRPGATLALSAAGTTNQRLSTPAGFTVSAADPKTNEQSTPPKSRSLVELN